LIGFGILISFVLFQLIVLKKQRAAVAAAI
jgi:hypothetical protein